MSVLTPNEKRWHLASLVYKKRELDARGVMCFDGYTGQKIENLRKQVNGQR